MNLSTAIRIGAALRPQAFGTHFKKGGSCVIGAALEGAGFYVYDSGIHQTESNKSFTLLSKENIQCPVCSVEGAGWKIISMCLNDTHKWTRESIADWIEWNFEGGKEVSQPKLEEQECLEDPTQVNAGLV